MYDREEITRKGRVGLGYCTSQFEGQCLGQRHVTSIGQRCDHQPTIQTHILVSIPKTTRALTDHTIVDIAIPIKPQLRLPGKFFRVKDGFTDETVDNVARVHVDDQQSIDLLSGDFVERSTDHGDQIVQLPGEFALRVWTVD